MKNNPALRKLSERIIRAEIEKRNPLDADVLTRFVSQSADVDDNGEIVLTDVTGPVVMNGARPVSLSEHLDTIERERPTLFQDKTEGAPASPARNPFAKSQHNLTEQMVLWRTDPKKAEALANEAGLIVK